MTVYNLIIICKTKTSASSSREPEENTSNFTDHYQWSMLGGGGGEEGEKNGGEKDGKKSLILRNRILVRQALVTSATWQLPSQTTGQLSVSEAVSSLSDCNRSYVTTTVPVPVHGYYPFTTLSLIVSSALIPPTQAI